MEEQLEQIIQEKTTLFNLRLFKDHGNKLLCVNPEIIKSLHKSNYLRYMPTTIQDSFVEHYTWSNLGIATAKELCKKYGEKDLF